MKLVIFVIVSINKLFKKLRLKKRASLTNMQNLRIQVDDDDYMDADKHTSATMLE